jgi:hypothetical protein
MLREYLQLQRNGHGQAWYLARHLKHLSGDLAASGFSEAALLVGAAAISVGDQAVRPSRTPDQAPAVLEKLSFHPSNARHG